MSKINVEYFKNRRDTLLAASSDVIESMGKHAIFLRLKSALAPNIDKYLMEFINKTERAVYQNKNEIELYDEWIEYTQKLLSTLSGYLEGENEEIDQFRNSINTYIENLLENKLLAQSKLTTNEESLEKFKIHYSAEKPYNLVWRGRQLIKQLRQRFS